MVIDFKKPYEPKDFSKFLCDFLPDDFEQTTEPININDLSFKPDRIKKVKLIGNVPSLENLCVYEIEHESESDPRATLSRETFRLMSNYGVKKALAIFISRNSHNYRFSLVTIDLKLEGSRVTKDYSNPRRYSFFLGTDAKVHTPTEFLINKGKIKDFKDLQDRFSIEVVTKEFFSELSNWYFWALKKVVFPKDAEKENNGKNIAVIRLITRLIFIWFMKQKGLIPENLFKEEDLKDILKDLSDNRTTYYKAILQNLFFATLNTPIEDRDFRTGKTYQGRNEDFMNPNVYRFHKLFKNPEDMKDIFNNIPFLNGGLFECLDRVEDKGKYVRIDGFSDREDSQANVPNFLFYSDEHFENLNKDYGTKDKEYRVRGIIDLLQTYNFTIDESTPTDVEIALDPELLGRVFENLLASYNPETATTARKATGSYYTPREIVDYMVNESIKQYLLTNTKLTEGKIVLLLSYEDLEVDLTNVEKESVIDALDTIRIIDPACGSGAFSMGILQKILLILQKVDPDSKKWMGKKLAKIGDPIAQKTIMEKLEASSFNYIHKLGIIRDAIYGVDIQPIATQIARLRCFISLLVDEKVDKQSDNMGIEPLPNLETKFVTANSLIGLSSKATVQPNLKVKGLQELEEKLKSVREIYFRTSDVKKKDKLREEDKKIRTEISSLLLKQGDILTEDTKKIADWDPYNSNKSANWFDPEWMFGVKDGFDIVIANPPYVDSEAMVRLMPELRGNISKSYVTAKGNWDLYIPFWELGFKLLNIKGSAVFITPNKWLAISYGKDLRELLRIYVYKICNCDQVKIFEAGNSPVVVFISKFFKNNDIRVDRFDSDYNVNEKVISQLNVLNEESWGFLLSRNLELILKMMKNSQKVNQNYYAENPFTVSEAYEVQKILTDLKTATDFNNSKYFKFVNTGTIEKYYFLWSVDTTTYLKKKYQVPVIYRQVFKRKFPKRFDQISTQKIVISGMRHFECALDSDGSIIAGKSTIILKSKNNSDIKIILALLNSNLISFYIKEAFGVLGIDGGINFTAQLVENLPLPSIDNDGQKKLRKLADDILKIVECKDWLNNSTKLTKVKEYEHQIDQMVYKLYNLTEKEKDIVENK